MPNGNGEEKGGPSEDQFEAGFWVWVKRTYSTEQVTLLQENVTNPAYAGTMGKVWDYYVRKVAKPEMGFWDWLSTTAHYPTHVIDALRVYYKPFTGAIQDTGYWFDYSGFYQRIVTYLNRMPDWQAVLMATYPRGVGGYAAGTEDFFKALAPEKWAGFVEERERLRKEEEQRKFEREWRALPIELKLTPERLREYQISQAWRRETPRPEYRRAFTQELMGLTGPEPYKEWFSSRYPSIVAEFQATIPKMEQRYWPGLMPGEVKEEVEKTWAEYLKAEMPRRREEYTTQYPFGIGGRPWAFAPRIQTVKF